MTLRGSGTNAVDVIVRLSKSARMERPLGCRTTAELLPNDVLIIARLARLMNLVLSMHRLWNPPWNRNSWDTLARSWPGLRARSTGERKQDLATEFQKPWRVDDDLGWKC